MYDECGNVLSATNESGTLSYVYDKAGMLIKETDGKSGETVSYFYDKAGRRTRLVSRERDISYGYGRSGDILTQKDRLKQLEVHYKYDVCGRETERRFGNGVIQKTRYDKAGRTVNIAQYTSSGNLISGEAYVYDKLGRRRMTVNEKGLVTIYKYDNQSRLETVYYPFNEDIKETARKEADKQGLYFQPSQGNAENYFLSSAEMIQLRGVAENFARLRGNAITTNQVVWKESYTYDANGNRTSKTTAWGTVQYAYDKENRLTESGELGKSESVKYTYDANGNLLRESAARYRKDYVYNAQNRMSFSDVQDSVLNTRNFTEYAYDAFGRRIETKEYLGDYTRNLYDGFSFDVIGKSVLQAAYSANIPEQMYRTTNRQSSHPATQERHPELVSGSGRNAAGTDIGTRYRYIDDNPLVPMPEVGTSSATANSASKTRSRPNNGYVLYSHGIPVAVNSDDGTSYFGTDILGSVRSVTDKYGAVEADYNYDAFGSPYLGNLENDIGFGYCGKVYDNGTGLYDYGFRDYSPVSARFTTIDPIRDGSNWFSYVVNDPVNYIDPFGLKSNDVKNYEYLGEWGGEKHYKAKSGATKWGLAHDTGHDVKDVKGYDGDPTKMPIGTELSIPSNSGSTPSESTQITATPPSNAQTTVGTTNAVVTQPSAPRPAAPVQSVPMLSNSASPVSEQGKSSNKSYLQRSVEQVVYGNYTDEVTLLGTAAQVLMGVFNIDVLADIRDLSADFVNWEWSGQHLFQTSTDLVAVLPLLGVAKYTDEATALIKNGKKVLNSSNFAGDVVNTTERAVLKNGFYEVNGFKFSEYYYKKLWNTGRGGSSLVAREILENATQVAPDAEKSGFFRYVFENWEMVYNPDTKEIWHILPID